MKEDRKRYKRRKIDRRLRVANVAFLFKRQTVIAGNEMN